MSLKAVELQIAVPRTSEAGKYQSEYQQRPMNEQALLGQKTEQETEKIRQRSSAVDESAETFVGERENGGQGSDTLTRADLGPVRMYFQRSILQSIHTRDII